MKRTNNLIGLLALALTPLAMQAQSVTLFGSLSNFDVLNDTGQDAHGFEIEMQGVPSTSAPYTFNYTRYGASKIIPTQNGIIIRWASAYDGTNQRFLTTTVVPASFAPTFGHSCVLTNIVGCDHYGVVVGYYGLTTPPTNTAYYWLVADPANPGLLMRAPSQQVQIPHPTVTVLPPAAPGLAPQVVFQIVAPVPPPPPIPKPVPQHGEAKWVKVYKTELQHEVVLEDLVADNPIVPQDAALAETTWKLLQYNPNSNGNSGILRNQGGLGAGSKSVLRRYEFYKFSGQYNALDHKAICVDVTCSNPAAGELGDFIGAQNAAANVGVPSITVTVVGDGQVQTSNNVIKCPGACSMNVDAGTAVTLIAKNGRGIFSGWTGACAGTTSLTCTTTVNNSTTTTATFLTPFRLSLNTTGLGSIASDQPSTTILSGTTVTLTATPSAGQTFSGWSGPCAGTALTCTFTMTADTIATAAFTGVVAPPPPTSSSFRLVLKANGSGKIASNPSTSAFASGSVVVITATPNSGVPFIGWSGGGCTGTALTCSVTMTADTTVTANFR